MKIHFYTTSCRSGYCYISTLNSTGGLVDDTLGFQTCASGFSGGAICVDGTVNYCHVHFGDQNQQAHTIFDNTLDLVDMIEQGSHYEDMKSKDCGLCQYKSVCTSGCPVACRWKHSYSPTT